MINAKQEASRILESMPDDCTLEEIQYRLYVAETIRNRLAEAERGEVATQAEVEERLEKWLKK